MTSSLLGDYYPGCSGRQPLGVNLSHITMQTRWGFLL